jgi:hypothetical protein
MRKGIISRIVQFYASVWTKKCTFPVETKNIMGLQKRMEKFRMHGMILNPCSMDILTNSRPI